MATTSHPRSFTIISRAKHIEVPLNLGDPVLQGLGLLDRFALWGNLAVSLLGPTGVIVVLQPKGTRTGARATGTDAKIVNLQDETESTRACCLRGSWYAWWVCCTRDTPSCASNASP